jgi:hypothetical protein
VAATPINPVSAVIALDIPLDLTDGVPADATNGNTTPNDGRVRLIVQNTGTATDTIAVTRTETVDGASLPARSITVAAGKTVLVGPFDPTVFSSALQYKAGATTTNFLPVSF